GLRRVQPGGRGRKEERGGGGPGLVREGLSGGTDGEGEVHGRPTREGAAAARRNAKTMKARRPSSSNRESSWRSVVHLLWLPPVGAVGFALFFGTLNGASRASYLGSYVAAVFFGY